MRKFVNSLVDLRLKKVFNIIIYLLQAAGALQNHLNIYIPYIHR